MKQAKIKMSDNKICYVLYQILYRKEKFNDKHININASSIFGLNFHNWILSYDSFNTEIEIVFLPT